MNLRNLAGAFSFAHLAGLNRSAKREADEARHAEEGEENCEEEDMEGTEHEEGAEHQDGDEGEEGTRRGTKKGKKKAKKARRNGEERDEHDDEDDDESGDEEDHDEDEEDEGAKKGEKKAVARGRRLERRRIGAILSHPAAAANMQLACRIACNTNMSASEAVILLETAGASQPSGRRSLSERMAERGSPRIGVDAPAAPSGTAAIEKSWERAAAPFMPAK
jgi:hypothetical protein